VSKINAHRQLSGVDGKKTQKVSGMLFEIYELTSSQISDIDQLEVKGKNFKEWVDRNFLRLLRWQHQDGPYVPEVRTVMTIEKPSRKEVLSKLKS
jgi:hypothetical protein